MRTLEALGTVAPQLSCSPLYSHLDNGSKVLAIDSVLRLQIEVTQLAGTHGVVLVIELVKALKCLPPLE